MTALSHDSFRWPIRIYIEDTDAGGIVYHARYLHFMERARTEWVRSQGVALRSGLEENVSYVVQKMSLHFRQPAKLDDEVWVTADLVDSGRVWMGFKQRIIRQSDGALLTEADVKVACTALDTGRPRALPEAMRAIASTESAKSKNRSETE